LHQRKRQRNLNLHKCTYLGLAPRQSLQSRNQGGFVRGRCRQLIAGAVSCLAVACAIASPVRGAPDGDAPLAAANADTPDQYAQPRATIARDHPPGASPVARLGQLPLAFAEPCGPRAGTAEFVARGFGYRVALAADTAHIGLLRSRGAAGDPHPSARRMVHVIGIRFIDANRQARGEALDPLPGHSSHFRPASRGGSCADVVNYERVRFASVYPDIDVVYYGNGRELEFDLVVHPGADPGAIRLAIDGADRMRIDAQGDLNLDVNGEALTLRRPVAYQERDGRREPIATTFALTGENEVVVQVAVYDKARALTIDPTLSYATYLGGTKTDYGIAVAVDASGNTYVAGYTTSADFPKLSAYDSTLGAGDVDAFVAKINSTGKALVYSTYLGGATGVDRAVAIAIDASGNAYVTGTTTGGFPTTAGAYQSTATGSDSFVAKLGPAGSTLLYATYVQGVEARGIAVDAAGSAYVAGKVVTSFATTAGAYQQTPGGAFVLKLHPAGTAATYATYLGHGGVESATAVAIDAQGSAYVAGSTDSSTFPVVNALQPASGGATDGFIAKLSPAGSGLAYSTYLGGALDDVVNAIAVDAAGNAYVAGETYSADFPVLYPYLAQKPGALLTNSALGSAFFAKVNASGNGLVYASFLGGEICTTPCTKPGSPAQYPGDAAYGIAVDAQGHAYISGLARSYTFPLVNSLKPAKTQDTQDSAFVAKVGRGGGTLLYSTFTRTGTSEAFNGFTKFPPGAATGMATDAAGAAYVTGDADSASNFTTLNAYQTTNGGGQGAIALKLTGAAGTLTLTSSAVAVVTPSPVTLTATVAGVSLSGSIVFRDGPTTIGSAAISSSKAVLTIALPVGIHRLTAIYATSGKELDSNVLDVVVDNDSGLICN
jgi:hypothetical protein